MTSAPQQLLTPLPAAPTPAVAPAPLLRRPSAPPAPPVPLSRPDGPLSRCGLLDLPVVSDPRGNLTSVEGGVHVPFDIQRVYYLYDVPGGAQRGGHAHKGLSQLVIAMSGSFDVMLDDGTDQQVFHLNRSYRGLLIRPMVWREIDNFSSGSVCVVLASAHYDEDDYYRDYEQFARASDGA